MIHVKIIDAAHKQDINLPNDPFSLWGRILPSYQKGQWSYEVVKFPEEAISSMCFPDESYDYDTMCADHTTFIGAYEDQICIGLAILQPGFFSYLYLYDLKVSKDYRGRHIGQMLLQKASEVALSQGYRGIYCVCQDNNPGACLFYLNYGFVIGGLDTLVYKGTSQEGKSDLILYKDY